MERACNRIADDDGKRHDHECYGQAFQALGKQHMKIELEPQQDDAQTQQFVGYQPGGVLHTSPARIVPADIANPNRELEEHAEDKRENQGAK
jgi:hypothetical protein